MYMTAKRENVTNSILMYIITAQILTKGAAVKCIDIYRNRGFFFRLREWIRKKKLVCGETY